jgi:regulator of extracellular matrix RemA (YlzA/DUF370 family)
MFIHLGEDILIKSNEVIAIFDYNLVEEDDINRSFVDRCLEEKKLIDVGEKSTKSIIVTDDYIYFSPFSPTTLKKRSQSNFI